MPTLEELQRWARGEDVEGLEPHAKPAPDSNKPLERSVAPAPGVDKDKMKSKRGRDTEAKGRRPRYTISAGGDDALLHFGKHNGKDVSAINGEDRTYLTWLLGQDWIPDDLKDVINHVRRASKPKGEKVREIPDVLSDDGPPPILDNDGFIAAAGSLVVTSKLFQSLIRDALNEAGWPNETQIEHERDIMADRNITAFKARGYACSSTWKRRSEDAHTLKFPNFNSLRVKADGNYQVIKLFGNRSDPTDEDISATVDRAKRHGKWPSGTTVTLNGARRLVGLRAESGVAWEGIWVKVGWEWTLNVPNYELAKEDWDIPF